MPGIPFKRWEKVRWLRLLFLSRSECVEIIPLFGGLFHPFSPVHGLKETFWAGIPYLKYILETLL